MSWKKNACSYLLWLIYTIAVSVGVIGICGAGFGIYGFPEEYSFPVSGVLYLIAGLLVLFLHKQAAKKKNMENVASSNLGIIVEGILFIILLAAGILLRASQMQYVSGTDADMAYFEAAKVTEGNGVSQVVHGATYLYLELLHMVFLLFGNKLLAAVWLQIVLQCLASVILYFAVRKLAGKTAAIVMMGILMLSPYMIQEAVALSPEGLYGVGLALVLGIIAGMLKKSCCNPLEYVLVGFMIGICCYFDLSGLLLLVAAAGVFTIERENLEKSWKKRGVAFLLNVLGVLGAWFIAIVVDAVLCGKEILNVMTAWFQLYEPSGFVISSETYTLQGNQYVLLFNAIILYALLVFGIFSFWCRKKQERQGIWVIMVSVLMALQCFQMLTPQLTGVTYLYVCLAVLAGVAVADIFAVEMPKVNVDSVIDNVIESIVAQETKKSTAEELAIEFFDEDMEDGSYFDTPIIIEEKQVEPIPEAPKKVKFLDNPLPLPKKHEAKVMDFKITNVSDSDYDFDVSADDDFDI